MTAFSNHFTTLGLGEISPAGTLLDATLSARLDGYLRKVVRRYRVISPHRMGDDLGDGELYISPKIDGELWFIVKKHGDVALCSPDGRALRGITVTQHIEVALLGQDNIIIAGELYAPAEATSEATHQRPVIHDLLSALRDGEGVDDLHFAAFDLLQDGDTDGLNLPYGERLTRLQELLDDKHPSFASVPTTIANAQAAIALYQEQVLNDLAEGLVVRSNDLGTFKIKPAMTIDAVVLGFGERRRGDIVHVRELLVGLVRDDGSYHILTRLTRGLSELDRLNWYKRLDPLEVSTSYRLPSAEGTLIRFVRPEIVVELQCHGLKPTTRRGLPVRQMVLQFNQSGTPVAPAPSETHEDIADIIPLITYRSNTAAALAPQTNTVPKPEEAPAPSEEPYYSSMGFLPTLRPTSVRYMRERADKRPNFIDSGLNQLHRYVPLESRDAVPSPLSLPKATVLQRKVFTKASRGHTMVRKYVALATRKSAIDKHYPPYVVHFTDFSPNRGEPLKTTLKTASNLERLHNHIQSWLDSNIKRGWEEA